MKNSFYAVFVLAFVFLFPSVAYSQFSVDWDGDEFNWHGFDNPTLSVSYGLTKSTHKGLGRTIQDLGNIEIKLGTAYPGDSDELVSRNRWSGVFISRASEEFHKKAEAGVIAFDMWRFGFYRESGYGYNLGQVSIIPFKGSSFTWTRGNADTLTTPAADRQITDLFYDTFRFGQNTEAGVSIRVNNLVEVRASYDRGMVFPRHMFWYWAGSAIIEEAALGLADTFIKRVYWSSPAAAPIVDFLLKNAISIAAYELRKDKMNYPFDTAAPLMTEQYKLSLQFVF